MFFDNTHRRFRGENSAFCPKSQIFQGQPFLTFPTLNLLVFRGAYFVHFQIDRHHAKPDPNQTNSEATQNEFANFDFAKIAAEAVVAVVAEIPYFVAAKLDPSEKFVAE